MNRKNFITTLALAGSATLMPFQRRQTVTKFLKERGVSIEVGRVKNAWGLCLRYTGRFSAIKVWRFNSQKMPFTPKSVRSFLAGKTVTFQKIEFKIVNTTTQNGVDFDCEFKEIIHDTFEIHIPDWISQV